MHTQERAALALLRSGRSYAEAAESSGLTADQVMFAWLWKSPGHAVTRKPAEARDAKRD